MTRGQRFFFQNSFQPRIYKEEKMTDKKYIQRLKLVLKCGGEFAIDFNAEENGKINPQIGRASCRERV